jgi:hemoglobin
MDKVTPLQRFDMTHDDVNILMTSFYASIRAHSILGPIFETAIAKSGETWHTHEAKIASFWRNAILMDRNYQGNPMRVHMMNQDIMPEHFPIWLDLFEEAAQQVLSADKATNISALARRIGAGLTFGVANHRAAPNGPPVLR